jgi:hypothetical protein
MSKVSSTKSLADLDDLLEATRRTHTHVVEGSFHHSLQVQADGVAEVTG